MESGANLPEEPNHIGIRREMTIAGMMEGEMERWMKLSEAVVVRATWGGLNQ